MSNLNTLMTRYLFLILFALVLLPLIPAVYFSSLLFNDKLYHIRKIEEMEAGGF